MGEIKGYGQKRAICLQKRAICLQKQTIRALKRDKWLVLFIFHTAKQAVCRVF